MKTTSPLLMTLALSAALATSAQAQTSTQPGNASAGAMQAAAPSASEKQALGVLSAINTSEINAANLALKKQTTGAVREYATRMLREHTENNQKIAKWSPDTSAADAKLQMSKGKAELSQLEKLDGEQFQAAYIKAMVKDHGDALDALDRKLIPAARTAQVADHLKTTRGHVADHLAAAKALQTGGNAAAR
ncbi:DUF4142 domain-containing protein [Xanthomonas melonis]|uniref:DUF4142 domain-containing protein n=1 Tax=Xanthomonas melonis TaxID=56456 RepID=A0ABS8NVS9_9XANT|nr:DUF4142 domain-containing protein [Xanthomonas melonis]MCD0257814.1 DUF4142 domain-containing protein [Xanthomonas melonis]MCD0266033.1 DUF4142 domain-containing protein [Xanthomonas melonis]